MASMVEEMHKSETTQSSHSRRSHVLVSLLGAVLVLVLFVFFLSSNPSVNYLPSETFSTLINQDYKRDNQPMENNALPEMATIAYAQDSPEGCDLFTGEWIPNPSGPTYTNATCKFIETAQNCMNNGRPDTDYLYWRWKPNGCDLLPFDPKKFLNAMKHKSWAFIGDSIFRNHIQSLLCKLSEVEEPIETCHSNNYKNRRWYFPLHKVKLHLVWAPYLIKAETSENDEGETTSETQLHLDILDGKWTKQYHKFDYVVISGGQWFLKAGVMWENHKIIGCHLCKRDNIPELGLDYPYRRALQTALNYIATSDHKPVVFFRTWSPDHFAYGEWFSGGICNRTQPYKEGEYNGKQMDPIMRGIEVEEFEKAAAIGKENGAQMTLVDTFHLSLLRPDGHPGPFRTYHPDTTKKLQNDCLHWCLPGPIDAWTDLIVKMVMDKEELKNVI